MFVPGTNYRQPWLGKEYDAAYADFADAGNSTFNAREGTHDDLDLDLDLVLALALAVFGLSRPEPLTDIQVVRAR